MVVNDFNPIGRAVSPSKTNAPLIVDSNAALAGAVAFEHFKPVARRHPQVSELRGNMKLLKFAQRSPLNVHPAFHALAMGQCFRVLAGE